MKREFFLVVLLSVIISSLGADLGSDDLQLSKREENNVGFRDCGEPRQVSGKTSCACLKTLYEGNMCKFSQEIKKPFGKQCRNGSLQHCCNRMHDLAAKRNCPYFLH